MFGGFWGGRFFPVSPFLGRVPVGFRVGSPPPPPPPRPPPSSRPRVLYEVVITLRHRFFRMIAIEQFLRTQPHRTASHLEIVPGPRIHLEK